ncbi:unnamed protein product [Ectocarpus sp. 8 AP-2014]
MRATCRLRAPCSAVPPATAACLISFRPSPLSYFSSAGCATIRHMCITSSSVQSFAVRRKRLVTTMLAQPSGGRHSISASLLQSSPQARWIMSPLRRLPASSLKYFRSNFRNRVLLVVSGV